MKLFDLDGTLLDSNGIWEEIDLRFLEKRGIPWSREYHEGVIHAIFPVAARFTKEFCRLAESEEEIMAEWLEMAYDAYAHRLPAKEGAAEYLAACAARGERLALYTSAEPSLAKAASLGPLTCPSPWAAPASSTLRRSTRPFSGSRRPAGATASCP